MNENIKHLREILEHATMHEPTRIEAMVCLDLLELDLAEYALAQPVKAEKITLETAVQQTWKR